MSGDTKTLAELSELYLDDRRSVLRKNTIEGYESSIALYVVPRFGGLRICEISRSDVREWVAGFDKDGAALKAYKCLRQIVRWSICELGIDEKDPTVGGFPRPIKPRKAPRTLTVEEVDARIRGFKGHWYEPIVLLCHSLGLRPGEAYGLEWRKINWDDGSVLIDVSLQYVKGEIIAYPTKTAKSTRVLYLPKKIRKRLKKIWKRRGKPSGRIIEHAAPPQVGVEIKRFAMKNGLPVCSMYNMRHTWATLMIENDVPIAKVSMMMGHADVTMTYTRYVSSTAKGMAGMADEWERIMS